MHFIPKLITATLLLTGFAINCYAIRGCRVTLSVPQTRIYTDRYPGSQASPVLFFDNTNVINESCPVGATSSITHPGNVSNTTTPGTVCWAEFIGPGTNRNNAGNYKYNGFLVDFIMVPCPIDDYVPFLLIGSAGLGLFLLKRRT